MKTILLGVSGSISAYKAADLTNQLVKAGYNVEVLMTASSTQFITPLTLQSLSKNIVHTDIMAEPFPDQINHIELAKNADLFIVAPASANTLAKLAHGLADDIISTVALALSYKVPKLIAPAMNTQMYQNPLTQRNIGLLKDIGYTEIAPRETLLACGDFGKGGLALQEDILTAITQAFTKN